MESDHAYRLNRYVFMFVQTFASGRGEVNPAAGVPAAGATPPPGGGAPFLVTLEGHPGITVYFSDRPDRIVGASPTEQFLDGLGFSPSNPPNAALVAEFQAGQGVVVLELIEPSYDPETGTLVYGAELLAGYQSGNLESVTREQVEARMPAEFGDAALFIDACPDVEYCWSHTSTQSTRLGPVPVGPVPMQYSYGHACCWITDDNWEAGLDSCRSEYPTANWLGWWEAPYSPETCPGE